MSGSGGTGDIGSAMPLSLSQKHSTIETPTGKLDSLSVRYVSTKNKISRKTRLLDAFKKIVEFSSITVVPSSQSYLTQHDQKAAPANTSHTEKNPEVKSEDSHEEMKTLVGKEATDLQITFLRNSKAWKRLEKASGSSKKNKVNKKGFSQLLDILKQKDISRKNDLNLMVLFAADKYEKGSLSQDQMVRYLDVLVEKYTTAKATEQEKVICCSLVPTGSERTGRGSNKPLRASESVQLAELIVTTDDRWQALYKKGNDIVQSYMMDFPLTGYGWQMDFKNISRTVDRKLRDLLSDRLKDQMVQESGNQRLTMTAEFQRQISEGIHRSLDEFADSLLMSARSRADSKGQSVRDSGKDIKNKIIIRRNQLVTVLQRQFGEKVFLEAMQIPVGKMVKRKVNFFVKTYESQSKKVTLPEAMTQPEQIPVAESKNDIGLELLKLRAGEGELTKDRQVEKWLESLPPFLPKGKPQQTVKTELAMACQPRDVKRQGNVQNLIKKFEALIEHHKK